MSNSGQKFVARNRAPRVQIEYDVEVYGSEKTVQLPFVTGVMADLSGASVEPLPAVADRKFLEFDVDNFDDRMKAIRPRAAFSLPNSLTGEGNLSVELTFERMEDFSPAAIARKVEPLRKLLEARTRLAHLSTYMDGKTGAEELIAKLISDPKSLAALTGISDAGSVLSEERTQAIESLRQTAAKAANAPAQDDVAAVLGSLRGRVSPHRADDVDSTEALFERMRQTTVVSDGHVTRSAPAIDTIEDASNTAEIGVEPGAPTVGLKDALGSATNEDEDNLDTFLMGIGAPPAIDSSDEAAETDELDTIPDDDFDLEAFLADDGTTDEPEVETDLDDIEDDLEADGEVDTLFVESGDDSDLGLEPDTPGAEEEPAEVDELDAIPDADDDFDLDAFLADAEATDEPDAETDLDDLSDAVDVDSEIETFLAAAEDNEKLALGLDAPDAEDEPPVVEPFGTLFAERPDDRTQPRARFRIALLGDFTGRAARGMLETGDSLAARKPIRFDVDNLDTVIARFATTLVLPIGDDGSSVEVKLNGLDDLHPDALYENVALFQDLSALRQRVGRGDAAAMADLRHWAGDHGDFNLSNRKRAYGNAVPADRKLSDFQALIGEAKGRAAEPSPAETLIGRIVGPYVQAAPDPAREGMVAAIDEALSGAMRAILHHPDFQAIESTWRSLEFLTRRIETGPNLEVVLYDVSAEEWAADLSAQNALEDSGLFRMLAEEPRLDASQGPLSAVFSLYTLEETPPHAELMARMAKISAWMNAPFVAAISPQFLETRKEHRHPLVAKTWDALRALPDAAYVGLATPRFLLRRPYGRRSEPVDPFDFEEFSLRSGLKGMLWANPVILSATVMAATATRMGQKMRLGEVMSLNDIPVHIMVDQYGDQIALPCTERLLDTRTTADVVARGFMPVLSIKGRGEIRQGSFQALGASTLAGPWPQDAGKGAASRGSEIALGTATSRPGGIQMADGADTEAKEDDGADDFDLSSLDGMSDTGDHETDSSLDEFLAGFSDGASTSEDDDLDPDLAALLESL